MTNDEERGAGLLPEQEQQGNERRNIHGVRLQPGKTLWAGWPDDPELRARIAEKQRRTKRKKRTFKESIEVILKLDVPDERKKHALEELGLDPTVLNAINIALGRRAFDGDVEAARFLRDTVGEKPREGLELGNLDGKPLASIDVTGMTDDELKALAAQRADSEETGRLLHGCCNPGNSLGDKALGP